MDADKRYSVHGSKSMVPLFDVLWTNSSPSDSFAGQTISIDDLGDYNLFIVEIALSTSTYYMKNSATIYIPDTETVAHEARPLLMYMTGLNSLQVVSRRIAINPSTEGVIFGDGFYLDGSDPSAGVTDNTVAIPISILGTVI